MGQSQFSLLGQRRFAPFFYTQALGAFNDNFYKNILVILVTYDTARYSGVEPIQLAQLAGGLFILPFVLFSGLAGQLADRYDRILVMRGVKIFEVAIMGIAALGFIEYDIRWLLAALFMMGMHSTFFAPAKYGLLPTVLSSRELVGGNALLEMGTFAAILLGQSLAGPIAASGSHAVIVPALLCVAILGVIASFRIPRLEPAAPDLKIDWNLWRSSLQNLRSAQEDRTVFLAILGISWFWFYGILVLAQMPVYASRILQGPEITVTVLMFGFTLGIGVGSLMCERLSAGRLEIGLVPFGSLLMTVFGIDLYFSTPHVWSAEVLPLGKVLAAPTTWHILADLVFIGLAGGLYIVPLYALVQKRTPLAVMSRVVAATSIWNALFMVAASLMGAALLKTGMSVEGLLLTCAVLNFVVTAFIYVQVPEFLLRFLAWILARLVYRVRSVNSDFVPKKGPALVVCNHVSYVDAIILSACIPRPMRFVMESAIFQLPVFNWIFQGMKAIPVASAAEDRAVREAAFAAVADALRQGHVVCIFPEGKLTRDGEMSDFRPGLLRILAENPVPVVPIALGGLWGSMFSHGARGFSRYLPVRLNSHVEVNVGEPIAPDAVTLESLYARVVVLRGAER